MSKELETPKFAILIATRNRPKKIELLLESISNLTMQPLQIVIVSSGDSIEEEVSHFRNKLNIEHLHLSQKGQIRQKIAGLRLINESAEWIQFLDDDVLLHADSIANIFAYLHTQPKSQEIVGIGLKNTDAVHVLPSKFRKVVSCFFGISTLPKGGVSKNGQNIDYMGSLEVIETQWLNGISMWTRELAITYNIPFQEAAYSICEDLIFSYAARKKGKLIFIPSARFSFQDTILPAPQTPEVFIATAYWRFYFVLMNHELSKASFFWSQIGRTLFFSLFYKGTLKEKIERFNLSLKILIDLFSAILSNKPGIEVLEKRQTS